MKMIDNYDFQLHKMMNGHLKKNNKRTSLQQLTSYNNEHINGKEKKVSGISLNNIKSHKTSKSRSKKQNKTIPLLLHSHSERLNVHNNERDKYSRSSLNSKIRYMNCTRDEENASELIFEEDPNLTIPTNEENENSEDEPSSPVAKVSFLYNCMHRLFPSIFPIQGLYQSRIKSAELVSGRDERKTGNMFVPVGQCSMFPNGMFVQTTDNYKVTKIHFPESNQMFILSK